MGVREEAAGPSGANLGALGEAANTVLFLGTLLERLRPLGVHELHTHHTLKLEGRGSAGGETGKPRVPLSPGAKPAVHLGQLAETERAQGPLRMRWCS